MEVQVGQFTQAQGISGQVQGGTDQVQRTSAKDRRNRRSGLERRIDELEKADKARQEFFAVLSHELRNPLQAIHTNAALIKSRTKDGELTRPAEAIDRQVTRLSKLLDDLLDVVKIAQREDLAFQTVALQQVVGTAVEATRRSFDTHRREVTVSMDEAPLYIRADAARLEQAIGHILANAVKFSGQQSEIAVRVFEHDGRATVAVRDQGMGITAGDIEQIFTRFEAGAARRDVSGGLGLGLHIARQVAELHGGSVEARSDGPGKGAEFRLSLPLTEERPTKEAPVRTIYNEACALRILVVDDNRDAADSLAMLLEMNGHTGMVAYDGASALEKAEKTRPHVALVDLGMPAMNGFEVAQRISTAPWGEDTVLVAITGWGAKSDRAKSKEAGFAYHLTKPVDYDTLASLLSTAARKPANGA
jgi:signal transduction histidine kinase/ActR/RegA family two-component response regulator